MGRPNRGDTWQGVGNINLSIYVPRPAQLLRKQLFLGNYTGWFIFRHFNCNGGSLIIGVVSLSG